MQTTSIYLSKKNKKKPRKFSFKDQGNIDQTVKCLTAKFVNLYNIKDLKKDVNDHLNKIFFYYLQFKVEKIFLYKSYNIDNSIKLEFRVCPSYYDKEEIKTDFFEKISIDKYFLLNLRDFAI